MYALYSLLLSFGLAASLPFLLLRRRGRALAGLRQRLGWIPLRASRPSIWVHAVSVGEALAAAPFIRGLRERYSDRALFLSTVTPTGQQIAKKVKLLDGAFYLPLDLSFALRPALERLSPELFVSVETEIWPNLLSECRRRKVHTALVNGRVSLRSFRRYRSVRFFMRRVLDDIELFCMQSEADAERIKEIGADPARVHVTGNMKYDMDFAALRNSNQALCRLVAEALGLDGSAKLLVVGSTMPGEEQPLIEAYVALKAEFPALKMLLAPRHPERFDHAAELLRARGLRFIRRSQFPDPVSGDVLLLDSIGELAALYSLADAAFIGGSLGRYGGHNPLEPAFFGLPVLFGPHMENFAEIAASLLEADAAVRVESAAELVERLRELLGRDEARRALGARAKRLLEDRRGATALTLNLISQLLGADFGDAV